MMLQALKTNGCGLLCHSDSWLEETPSRCQQLGQSIQGGGMVRAVEWGHCAPEDTVWTGRQALWPSLRENQPLWPDAVTEHV